MKYSELLNKWLYYKETQVRTSTLKNYQRTVKNWINPTLGNLEIQTITTEILQDFIISFSKSHKRNTVINLSKPLSGSFTWALAKGYIPKNPWNSIKIPPDFFENEIYIFFSDEISTLLDINCPQYKKDIILLAYRTGMRIGEILALKWLDIDFNNNFLMVRRTLSDYNKGKPIITRPKAKSSRRRIDLDKKTMEMFHRRKKEDTHNNFVFCKKNGSIYSRQAIKLPELCKAVGIPARNFHVLRHTHATILLSADVHPKIVQARLGHSKITTTLDTYSHLIPGMQQMAVDVLNKL